MRRAVLVCLLGCAPLSKREPADPSPGPKRAPTAEDARAALLLPEAARLVVAEQSASGSRLVLVREDGRRFTDLTEPAADITVDAMPAWSPDGLRLAFVSSRESGAKWSLWVIDLLDGTLTRMTKHDGFDAHPAWSPDGKWIAFSSSVGGTHDLWRVAVERGRPGKVERLTSDEGNEVEPAWSPDGKSLAFTAYEGDTSRIRVLALDGRRLRDVTVGPVDRTAAWFPDGKRLIVSGQVAGRDDRDLVVVDVASGKRRTLVDEPLGDEEDPTVTVDGRHVLATSVLKSSEGEPLLSSLVVVDLSEKRPEWRALYDRFLGQRHGVTVAPVPLRADVIARAPTYREAVKNWLRQAGEEEVEKD